MRKRKMKKNRIRFAGARAIDLIFLSRFITPLRPFAALLTTPRSAQRYPWEQRLFGCGYAA